MKTIHIIPSTFEYFNDIRNQAFELVKHLADFGVEADAITLQYNTPSRAVKHEVRTVLPEHSSYAGHERFDDALARFAEYNLVHVHCPFFGAAGKILHWKQTHPTVPLVVTYYYPVPFTDLFSGVVKLYSNYYQPKLFQVADCTIFLSLDSVRRCQRQLKQKENIVSLDSIDESEYTIRSEHPLTPSEHIAAKVCLVYNDLIHSSS